MTISNYPRLNAHEFNAACHALDSRYRQARLGPLRLKWRLNVHTTYNLAYLDLAAYGQTNDFYGAYLRIKRPIEAEVDPGGLASALDKFSMGTADVDMDEAMMAAEQADMETIQEPPSGLVTVGYVTYEIHLHPTYQVPCLWFSLDMVAENNLDIDTVFRYLVPHRYRQGLYKTNGLGGISMDNHPVTGELWFFLHPCFTGQGMEGFECDENNYLPIWFGLMGGPVGLWLPTAMMTPERN